MKRYLLFAGSTYYAPGGWNDYIGSYDSSTVAEQIVLDANADNAHYSDYDWWHVVDAITMKVVLREGFAQC